MEGKWRDGLPDQSPGSREINAELVRIAENRPLVGVGRVFVASFASSVQHSGRMPRVYVVAGELSGDAHGAGLLRELAASVPGLELRGVGGPEIAAVACGGVRDWVGEAAVMGIWEVLKKYRWFRKEFHRMLDEVCRERPDVLLLVDYPGFNLRFAAAVRRRSPSTRIIQYVSPQVWAWNRRRIPEMARVLDELICLFPFEKPLLEKGGVKVSFVGHPLADELEERRRAEVVREEGLIGLFPGSREREVSRLMPMMIGVARLLRDERGVRFEVPAATAELGEKVRGMVRGEGAESFIHVTSGGSHSLMQRAVCAVIASGTATLEAAYLGVPHCIVYRVAPLTYWVARMVVRIRHIGIVNILAGREVVPEFIQSRAEARLVSAQLRRMLDTPGLRERMAGELSAVCAGLGGAGVHARAAEVVARWLPGGCGG